MLRIIAGRVYASVTNVSGSPFGGWVECVVRSDCPVLFCRLSDGWYSVQRGGPLLGRVDPLSDHESPAAYE